MSLTLAIDRVVEVLTRRPASMVALLVPLRATGDAHALLDGDPPVLPWARRWRYEHSPALLLTPAGQDPAGVIILSPMASREAVGWIFNVVVQAALDIEFHGYRIREFLRHGKITEWWKSYEDIR